MIMSPCGRGRSIKKPDARLSMMFIFAMVMMLLVSRAEAESCSVFDSCGACRNTTLCHWCPDQQCHTIGSIHGCFYGTYCYNNDQCQRELPEYRGYAAPSIGVLLGVFLVGSTAFVCGIAAISIAREYAKESASSRESAAYPFGLPPPSSSAAALSGSAPPAVGAMMTTSGDGDEYVTLAADENSALVSRPANDNNTNHSSSSTTGPDEVDNNPFVEEEGHVDPEKKKAAHSRAAGRARPSGRRRGRIGRSAAAAAEAHALPGPSPLARKVLLFTRLICGAGMAAALMMCAIVVGFAPHAPGVNVCNTEFDWSSIVNSIKKISMEADFQILVSIYNPNMLDAEIENGSAVLYHKHLEVGTMAFQPALLEGGYVTDILLTISIDGKAWDDAHLGWEYETGQLAFLMDATISASVMWHGFKTYPFTFSVHDYYIKVSDTTAYDRSLCNCTQMMQGTRRLPYLFSGDEIEEGDGRAIEMALPVITAGDDRAIVE